MSTFNITPIFPSPILKDFLTYIDYCEKHIPKVTKTNQFIGRKDVYELNQMMEQKTEGLTPKNDQHHYPMLHLFFHLSITGDLFFIERKKANAYFSPNQEKLKYFHQLNATQQYFYLFKTFFVYCDWENIQLQDRANIMEFGVQDVFEWCSAHQPNDFVSFDSQQQGMDMNLSWLANSLGVVMIYLEYFGFWKCKISERYRTRTYVSAESILISKFGIEMCECILNSRGYLQWNIYTQNELGEENFEAMVELKKLKKMGKTEEEASKIIEEIFDKKEKAFKKFSTWEFEDFFQEIFPNNSLGKIEVKAPKEFKAGIYTFKVNLSHDPKVIRRIQLDATHTLYDLHLMIQDAYDFEDDHLYSFYMDGKQYSKLRYNDPRGEEPPFVDKDELGDLEHLAIRKKILYLFDYGDSWWFDIVLEKIEEGELDQDNGKIIESIGESPEQYPNYEDDDW